MRKPTGVLDDSWIRAAWKAAAATEGDRLRRRQKLSAVKLRLGPESTREEIAAAFREDLTDPRHGTKHGYSYFKCRCDRCRQASTDADRQRGRTRRKT